MKKIYSLLLIALTSLSIAQTNVGITGNVGGVYINEFRYDNVGADVDEFIEVAGPAGTDLSTYTITLYNLNGTGNVSYSPTTTLSGTIDNEGSGFGAVSFLIAGIQNGAPDAIALSKTGDTNVQFLSYEGTSAVAATNGSAMGLVAVDILVSQSGTNAIGTSLEYDEATTSWVEISDDTPGSLAQGPVLSVIKNTISGLSVYPNPVKNGVFYINTNANAERTVTFYDVVGKQVLHTTTYNGTVNVSSLNVGIYIAKITEEGKTSTKKLIIE